MPIHDWTRVNAGTFHDFHQTWIIEIKRALNSGLLPADYYAMAEQIAGGWGPDVLTLERPSERRGDHPVFDSESSSAVAIAEIPPKARFHVKKEVDQYAEKADRVVIRHASGDQVVAMIEIVSPGNKNKSVALSKFVEKAVDVLNSGVHLLVVDLFPPGRFDPRGIHGAIWAEYAGTESDVQSDDPLTLASYIGSSISEAYVEPTAVGRELLEMPLFLDPDAYVPVPLEETYQSAWEAVPAVWRRVLEGAADKA